MAEKKYTPREAAVAVLQKAEAMMKNASFGKAQLTPPDGVVKEPGPASPAPANPQAAATPANAVQADPAVPAQKQHVTKGPIKLARFMGHMDHKRKTKTVAVAPATPPPTDAPKGQ